MSEIEKVSQFKLMEAADNAQIVAEINGEMLKEMVYTVKGKSRLSYAGAKFAAIQLGNIHVKDATVTYNKELDQFEASALAYNGNSELTLPGFAEQPRLMKVWQDKKRTVFNMEPDEFARRKAASKAVRNALMSVMPADHIGAYMQVIIDQGKARVIVNKPKQVEAEVVLKREDPTPPPPPNEVSVDSLHYRLGKYVIGIDDVLTFGDRDDHVRILKKRNLGDDEFTEINGRIQQLGGQWSKDDNCWMIPKKKEEGEEENVSRPI